MLAEFPDAGRLLRQHEIDGDCLTGTYCNRLLLGNVTRLGCRQGAGTGGYILNGVPAAVVRQG